jgi:hypothetical protein
VAFGLARYLMLRNTEKLEHLTSGSQWETAIGEEKTWLDGHEPVSEVP